MEGAKPEEAKDNPVVSPEKQNVEPRNIRLINTEISPKEVFWNNLMLLGFNSQEHERLYGIPFHMDMFDQSNGKGMQVIFYFLFRLINRDKAKKAFKACWPSLDVKSHTLEFKKQAHQLLVELEQEGRLPPNTVRLSHLQMCGGSRFYNLLLHLSTVAMRSVLSRKYSLSIPACPSVEPTGIKTAPFIARALKLKIALERNKFIAHAQSAVASQTKWREFAHQLENDYRQTTQKLNKVKEEARLFQAQVDRSIFSAESMRIRQHKINEIRQVWGTFSEHFKENKSNMEIMENIMENKVNTHCLNGAELQPELASFRSHLLSSSLSSPTASTARMPQNLTYQECQQLLAIDPFTNDKLDIIALIDLWTASLAMLKKRLTENKLLKGKGECTLPADGRKRAVQNIEHLTEGVLATVRGELLAHQHHLGNVHAVNTNLLNKIPRLKESINVLRQQLHTLAQLPTVSIPSTATRAPSTSRIRQDGNSFNPDALSLTVATPEAFEKKHSSTAFNRAVLSTPLPSDLNSNESLQVEQQVADSVRRAAKKQPFISNAGSVMRGERSAAALRKQIFSKQVVGEERQTASSSSLSDASAEEQQETNDEEDLGSDCEDRRSAQEQGSSTLADMPELSPLRMISSNFLYSPLGSTKPTAVTTTTKLPPSVLKPLPLKMDDTPLGLKSVMGGASELDSPFNFKPLLAAVPKGNEKKGSSSGKGERSRELPTIDHDEQWLMTEPPTGSSSKLKPKGAVERALRTGRDVTTKGHLYSIDDDGGGGDDRHAAHNHQRGNAQVSNSRERHMVWERLTNRLGRTRMRSPKEPLMRCRSCWTS